MLAALALRALPSAAVAWLERRRAPLGERVAVLAAREGLRRWRRGRRVHDQFIPF